MAGGWWQRVTTDSTLGCVVSMVCTVWPVTNGLIVVKNFSCCFNIMLVGLVEIRCRWCIEAAGFVDPPVVADVRDSIPCQRKTLLRFEPLFCATVTVLNSVTFRWL